MSGNVSPAHSRRATATVRLLSLSFILSQGNRTHQYRYRQKPSHIRTPPWNDGRVRAVYRAAPYRHRATSSSRLRGRKASDGQGFVLKHLEDGVQFGDLQEIVHTLGEVQ